MQFTVSTTVRTVRILVILCVCYNACLSFINAHVFSITKPVVILSEILLLGSLLFLVFQTHLRQKDRWPLGLLVSAIFTTIIAFFATGGSIYVDCIRNILIISVCVMVGSRMAETELHLIFFIISALVFAFLLIEIVSLPTFASIFRPADYYANTRGILAREYNETGLFHAALGYSDRFSFGVFSGPRTSSVFLEQVSLGNFASILAIYTLVFWDNIQRYRRYYITLIGLIILSSNSRFGGLSVAIFFGGYYIFHKCPKYTNVLILPLLLLIGVILLNYIPDPGGDNLMGRLHMGYRMLYTADFVDLFGFGVSNLKHYGDSGLAYLFFSNSVFTAIPLIIFIKLYIPQNSIMARRFVLCINLYIFLNLVVSGNSIFSIKTAVLLWLMVGFVFNKEVLSIRDERQRS